jgi:hypothetical protein
MMTKPVIIIMVPSMAADKILPSMTIGIPVWGLRQHTNCTINKSGSDAYDTFHCIGKDRTE